MLRRLLGGGIPDLITVLVSARANGGYDVQFIYDGRPAVPKEPPPMATLTETRTAVDALIRDRYLGDERLAQRLLTEYVGIGYTIYPWPPATMPRPAKMPKELASRIGQFLVIDVDEVADGFVAHVEDLEVTAGDLDALATKAEQAIRLRWPELQDADLPAMLNWVRRLMASGFVSPPPWTSDATPGE